MGVGLSARMVATFDSSFVAVEEFGPPPNLKGVFPVPAKVPAAVGAFAEEAGRPEAMVVGAGVVSERIEGAGLAVVEGGGEGGERGIS